MQQLEQRLIALLAILALAGYPLVSIVPTVAEVNSHGISVFFRAVVIVLSLIVITNTFVPLRKTVPVRIPVLVFLLCSGVLLVRYGHDVLLMGILPNPPLGAAGYLLFFVGVTFVPTLALFRSLTLPMLVQVHRILIWVVGLVVLVYSVHFVRASGGADIFRAQADAFNAITYGSLGAMLILLVFTYRFSLRWYFLWVVRALAVFLGAYALMASASRGPVLALALPLLVLMHDTVRRHGFTRPAAWVATLTGTIGFGLIAAISLDLASSTASLSDSSYLLSRILNFSDDDSTQQRWFLIQSSWDIFLNNPIVGGAIFEPVTKAYPHNIVLEGLMVGGILMGLLILGIVLYAFWLAWSYMRTRNERTFLGALLMFAVVMSMISGSLYFGPEFWSIFAIAAASRRSAPSAMQAEVAHSAVPN